MASDDGRVRLGFKEIAEVSKPRIIVLLVITAVTSMYAASKLVGPELDNVGLLHIIIAGALASAGSSALNHYYDRDIDPKMTRTSQRPIPSGRISASSVLIYGLTMSCISVIYGYFALNPVSAFFIALGIFSYVIIYTAWLKRLNSWKCSSVGWMVCRYWINGFVGILNRIFGFCLDPISFLVPCYEN
jgi:protoheme IX farnesyltransferase